MIERPSWDEYFMLSAAVIASRASCLKLHSGAVIVKNKRIISSGYNGNPPGVPSCYELGYCNKDKQGVDWGSKGSGHCLATHAEANAILQNHEQNVHGSTMYSIYYPCNECSKLIASSGIKELVYLKFYKEEVPNSKKILEMSGVKVRQISLDSKKLLEMIDDVINSKVE
jgi:dCMP deaminase